MNITISFSSIKKGFLAFLKRFHVMIFVIVVLNGLTITILLLNSIIVQSGDSGDYKPESANTAFDQATIQRVKELKTRDQDAQLTFPSGRINPFVE